MSGRLGRLWYSRQASARLSRIALAPAAGLYAALTGTRNALYDAGVLRSVHAPIATLGVGNLTVGGTGKTPVSAWLAGRLRDLGGTPAIVMRGYGDDEPYVHSALNPDIPVVTGADRVDAVCRAAALGADVAVLDDVFQHRRLRRDVDLLLVSADAWLTGRRWRLPAGPWRESLGAATRATDVALTVKAATNDQISAASDALRLIRPDWPTATVQLSLGELRRMDEPDSSLELGALASQKVLLIAAIADAAPLTRQMAATGALCTLASFSDHHAFTDADLRALVAQSAQHDLVVCTLKDAVKLVSRWPRAAATLWYVSQRIDVPQGERSVLRLLEQVLRARSSPSTT